MGSDYHQETIIRTFQSLDDFRDTNMNEIGIRGNRIETSFMLDGSILQHVQGICLKSFTLSGMYITDIDAQAMYSFRYCSRHTLHMVLHL
jgi:hypothetical protein